MCEPTSADIVKKLFEIYEKTGRIVADAFVPSNFIKTANGSVVCIDVGAALKLERRMYRQKSVESLNFWNRFGMSFAYHRTFSEIERAHPTLIPVIKATKALLHLQAHRPDCRRVSELPLLNEELIEQLAAGYDNNNRPTLEVDLQLSNYHSPEELDDNDNDAIPPDDATPLVAHGHFNFGLFTQHLAQIKKPESWLDRLARGTTVAWCNKLL